jgi:hypothetical protein
MKIGRKKPKYSEKTCSSATLSTTNPIWLDPGFNPGRRGGKPATNLLSTSLLKLLQPTSDSIIWRWTFPSVPFP